ncbi:MAG: hypothetical protein HC785_26280 [Calothrix sp. CSU_2_0]|nr:hypothetical protein [Calothrix sp. CSU_2_0]
MEKNKSSDSAKYLTYYTFTLDFHQPVNPDGASAIEVHKMITFLEEQIVQSLISLSSESIAEVKSAGQYITKWVQNSMSMVGSFSDEESSYFLT